MLGCGGVGNVRRVEREGRIDERWEEDEQEIGLYPIEVRCIVGRVTVMRRKSYNYTPIPTEY